ncbi:MAG TPA: hypothetical protein EYP08_07070 [Pyrodictiaceae archaeon]|nr:hypothetical protein [Pyrodictiaceae archaeon]
MEVTIVAIDAHGRTSVEKVEVEIVQPQETMASQTTTAAVSQTKTMPTQTPSKTLVETLATKTTPIPSKVRVSIPTVDYTAAILVVVVGLVAALAVYLIVSKKM